MAIWGTSCLAGSKHILAFSMIHFPSLYFWLSSNASTCELPTRVIRTVGVQVRTCVRSLPAPSLPHRSGKTQHWPQSALACKQWERARAYIFPAQDGLTTTAVDVGDGVQACDEIPVLLGTHRDVDPVQQQSCQKIEHDALSRGW